MLAYTKSQQRKKEKSERLRGERYQINFTELRFERWQFFKIKEILFDDSLHF